MNYDPELERFAFRFLEHQGAVLEKRPAGFEALLPRDLRSTLETPEHIHITTETGADGVYVLQYGSSFLEKMVNAACAQMPFVANTLEFHYLKSAGFTRLIRNQFTLHGSTGRVQNKAKTLTEYLFITCYYLAQSDEQKEGLFHLIFNLDTGAHVPEMADGLTSVPLDFLRKDKTLSWSEVQIDRIMGWIQRQAKESVMEQIGPFQQSMTRRFIRDVTNLEEYYRSLEQEMQASLQRTGLSAELIQDRTKKITLIPAELARKRDDLFKKYSIRTRIAPCSAMFIRTPAVKVLYRVSLGRKTKNISLLYNPVTKTMDPVVCEGCGTSTTRAWFCKQVHLLCQECQNRCPLC